MKSVKQHEADTQAASLWEAVRGAGLGEAVVAVAVRKAHLHPQMRVALAGPGAGELAEGLAGRVAQVVLLEGQDETVGGWDA